MSDISKLLIKNLQTKNIKDQLTSFILLIEMNIEFDQNLFNDCVKLGLNSEYWDVRLKTVKLISKIKDQKVFIDCVKIGMNDDDWDVRFESAKLISKIDDKKIQLECIKLATQEY